MPEFDDPLSVRAQNAEIEALSARLAALEARPRITIPAPLVPSPVFGYPSADWYQPCSSASLIQVWEMIVPRWTGLAVWARVNWRTGAGTTGAIRLIANRGGTFPASDTVPVAAASSGTIDFLWLHNGDIWTEDVLWVQAQRTAGANLVEIGFPAVAMVGPEGATTAGV